MAANNIQSKIANFLLSILGVVGVVIFVLFLRFATWLGGSFLMFLATHGIAIRQLEWLLSQAEQWRWLNYLPLFVGIIMFLLFVITLALILALIHEPKATLHGLLAIGFVLCGLLVLAAAIKWAWKTLFA